MAIPAISQATNPAFAANRLQLVRFGCTPDAKNSPDAEGDSFRRHHSKKNNPELDAQIEAEKNPVKRAALKAIRWYQKNDAIHNGYKVINLKCIYTEAGSPSCSTYTLQAIQKYGVIKGCWLGFWRIMNCNPISKHFNLHQKYFVTP